jgi:hypothetical protein
MQIDRFQEPLMPSGAHINDSLVTEQPPPPYRRHHSNSPISSPTLNDALGSYLVTPVHGGSSVSVNRAIKSGSMAKNSG